MEEKKEIAVYYQKPVARLGDMKPGDYVFDDDANLSYIDEDYVMHHFAIERWCNKDTVVYPVTIMTNEIMERMRKLRQKYHDSNIMNSYFSKELEDGLHEIMSVDINDEDCTKKEEMIWGRLERRYEELVEHAKALHIYTDPVEKLLMERERKAVYERSN